MTRNILCSAPNRHAYAVGSAAKGRAYAAGSAATINPQITRHPRWVVEGGVEAV